MSSSNSTVPQLQYLPLPHAREMLDAAATPLDAAAAFHHRCRHAAAVAIAPPPSSHRAVAAPDLDASRDDASHRRLQQPREVASSPRRHQCRRTAVARSLGWPFAAPTATSMRELRRRGASAMRELRCRRRVCERGGGSEAATDPRGGGGETAAAALRGGGGGPACGRRAELARMGVGICLGCWRSEG
ncbi:hypothetical protein ACP4OV_026901 [Aristida adscensionis]